MPSFPDQLRHYFPDLTSLQYKQLVQLPGIYGEWNKKINIISRKDIDHIGEHHLLHSLVIAKYISFAAGSRILDAGTGGGLPGIPLAILFPEAEFVLADSVAKKIKVVDAIANQLQLENVKAVQARVEELNESVDFILSRALAPMKTTYNWTKHLVHSNQKSKIPNGWFLLKGGDLQAEILELGLPVQMTSVSNYFQEEFFKEKFIVFIPAVGK